MAPLDIRSQTNPGLHWRLHPVESHDLTLTDLGSTLIFAFLIILFLLSNGLPHLFPPPLPPPTVLSASPAGADGAAHVISILLNRGGIGAHFGINFFFDFIKLHLISSTLGLCLGSSQVTAQVEVCTAAAFSAALRPSSLHFSILPPLTTK